MIRKSGGKAEVTLGRLAFSPVIRFVLCLSVFRIIFTVDYSIATRHSFFHLLHPAGRYGSWTLSGIGRIMGKGNNLHVGKPNNSGSKHM